MKRLIIYTDAHLRIRTLIAAAAAAQATRGYTRRSRMKRLTFPTVSAFSKNLDWCSPLTCHWQWGAKSCGLPRLENNLKSLFDTGNQLLGSVVGLSG